MHALAPLVIIFGGISTIVGFFWIIAAENDRDDGPDVYMAWIFGFYYLGLRVLRQLIEDPLSVVPGFGFLAVGGLLIWVGVLML